MKGTGRIKTPPSHVQFLAYQYPKVAVQTAIFYFNGTSLSTIDRQIGSR
jgi:hypothetical protein